jgi:hypothetical protein
MKSPGPDRSTAKLYQNFKNIAPMFLILFYKIQRKATLPNSFYESSIILILKLVKHTT